MSNVDQVAALGLVAAMILGLVGLAHLPVRMVPLGCRIALAFMYALAAVVLAATSVGFVVASG